MAILVASMMTVWGPTPRPLTVQVLVQAVGMPPSRLQMTVAVGSVTSKLMVALREQKVPAVGFVNEKKLYKIGEVDARIKALSMWVESGFELGNHTYSHFSLNKVGLKAWEDDVIQGESVTRILLGQHNMQLRYFRHPYLDTGRDLETRRQAEWVALVFRRSGV